jgi:muramoyltetrapeptide carboxypeptidase
MSARKPTGLRPGDEIGIAAPAGPVDEVRLAKGVAELERLGFSVKVADGVLERKGFTAGPVETRVTQLHGLFADRSVAAVMCARGGAGAIQLLPYLDRELLRANPKPFLGYSDATLLHLELGRLGLVSLHGPMVARELADGESAYDRASLWHALTGDGAPYASSPGDLVCLAEGEAEGILRGGCLSLLAAAVGTPWALWSMEEPTILFIEDVDEKPYRIDRMLRQLRASGAFSGVKGVVFGDMKGCTPSYHDGYRLEEVLLEALAGLDVPVAFGLSSGHTTHPNVTLPLGVRAWLECRDGEARFAILEPAVA